jgi:hypothetical protein
MNGKINTDNVSISQPVINIKSWKSGAVKQGRKFPEVAIGRINIQQPEIHLSQTGDRQFSSLHWKGGALKDNFLEIDDFKISEHAAVSADKVQFSVKDFSCIANGKKINTGLGEVRSTIEKFYLEPAGEGEMNWRATVSDLHASGFSFDSIGKKKGQLEIVTARLNGLTLNSASFTNLRQLIKENKAFDLKEITGHYSDEENSYAWANAYYDRSSKTLSVDSFAFHPFADRDSFIASHPYQVDYITMRTGPLLIRGFDPDRYLDDTVIDAHAVTIEKAYMTVFRDKRSPLKAGNIKLLPTRMVRMIPIHFSLDTIRINDAYAEYSELNENTNQTGKVTFSKLNAKIFPVTNYGRGPRDSLSISAQAWLLDSIKIKLNIRESYTDSLAGFLMTASAPPADPKILNSMLMPLASFQLQSGVLDTLSLWATATDRVATGEMKMFYHNLKIEFFNTKKEKDKKFLSFLASLFVKKNNKSTTGIIFWERWRDRSFLNYIVKIVSSGASSSTGTKNNKKLLRKYKKDQRKRNLTAKGND